jgi:hypothetical protein
MFQESKLCVTTLLLEEWEDDSHTPKMGTWESTGTTETSEFDCMGQNTLHWGVFYIIEKLSKCRCRKWVCISHLDICSTSYNKKKLVVWLPITKIWESTRPRCVQVKCDIPLESSWRELQVCFKLHPNRRSEQKIITSQNGGSPTKIKSHLDVGVTERRREYYMGEGSGFPRVRAVVSLVSRVAHGLP